MKICIIGASGKLGKYMVQHALDRGHEVVGVCRERSVSKLKAFEEDFRAAAERESAAAAEAAAAKASAPAKRTKSARKDGA